uniref:AF4/FMR2 C-terminal homology domain-containing protein n=1 Tax=Xiphophorus couchianus TaxID=32473 RepID=A0A3B5M8U2_9TELE
GKAAGADMDWKLLSLCLCSHLESERSALKRREWERRNQEVQQDEDLFSTGFNLFGEPYKTNKGDALANRVQNTLGSYEEMKDLLTSHSNQSHLVGIPKGSATRGGGAEGTSMQPPAVVTSLSNAPAAPHQNVKKSRNTMEWSKGGQVTGLVVGSGAPGQNGQGQVPAAAAASRGKMGLLEEQQLQRHEELFSSLKDELGLKEESSPSSSVENVGSFKTSPFENETTSHLSLSSSPLASTSVLTTPTPGLTTPTSGLTTPTFPPGCLSGKPIAIQQKPTAYVRPMDGQDQAPSDSPQLKPPPVATEGFSSSQSFGGTSGNAKNKLPKLNLSHTGEVRIWSCSLKLRSRAFLTRASLPAPESISVPRRRLVTTVLVCWRCDMLSSFSLFPPPLLPFLFCSGASGSSSESESSSESDTDESESSSSDSDYNQASRTNSPEPEPPSTNKWQLDSWLNKVQAQTKPLVPAHPAAREKDLLPPLLEHQNPPRLRGKPLSGKTAPRKEPRSATSSATPPAAKHRGPSTKITPKSREFIETDSSSSSSECQSDGEEATKIPSLPAQTTLGTFAGTGLRVKDGVGVVGNGNLLSISNIGPASPPSNSGHDVALSPLREYHEVQSLWVKIDLSFLSRVPGQTAGERARIRVVDREGNAGRDRERQKLTKGERQEEENEHLVKDKERQGDRERQTDREDRESGSLNRKQTRRRDDKLLPPLLSPLSDEPPRKRACDGGPFLAEEAGVRPFCLDAGLCRHELCSLFLLFSRVHSAEYYMQEAKRLKHKADALTDKFGKAVNYADGALSFIECGNAMERDPLEAKSPYTMYSETVELIRYAMRLKNFTSHSATVLEKRLAVLWYDPSLQRLPVGFPSSLWDSPPVCVLSRVNGTPSPLSLSPSPAGSGGATATGGGGASGSSSSVAIPQRIHHMAASHVNITNNILRSYEQWETADRLAADNFFQDLDSAMGGALSQQSSMVELVRYIRQGLHWLRSEAQLL